MRQAQNIAESNPDDALTLLDSIPNPENMDKDNYMQYIVTHVQAKQRAHHDIINDTLIFEAQQYFDKKNDSSQAALAHYFAGRVYRVRNIPDKALESFLNSELYALQSNNNTLAGKDVHIIGNLYFEQGIMDTAIVFYKKALNYYEKDKDSDKYKMHAANEIGRAYDEIKNVDSSYVYFNKAMVYAERSGDQEFKVALLNNLGYIYFRMKDYDKSLDYLHNVLKQTSDATIYAKTYLILSDLYNAKNQSDSARYYINLSERSLAEIADNQALKVLYNSFVDYFKQTGDYKQALQYKIKGDSIKELIAKNERPLSLLGMDKNFHLEQKDKQAGKSQADICMYFFIGGVFCIILLIFALCVLRVHKRDREEIKEQAEKYRKVKDQLMTTSAEYKELEAEIAAMLNDENNKD